METKVQYTAEEVANARTFVDSFLKDQVEVHGVKRSEVARSLFNKEFSEVQVGLIMNVNPKTAHAMKVNFSKAGKETSASLKAKEADVITDRLAIQNFLKGKGGAIAFNEFYKNVRILVGIPHRSKQYLDLKAKAKAEKAKAKEAVA